VTSVVAQGFWDSSWAGQDLEYRPELLEFKDLFDAYLPRGGTCFEVGCYPGNYLIYLGQRFGYTVSGVDLTPFVNTRMPGHLANNRVPVGELVHADFLAWTPRSTYDVVCSFGFVEHFEDYAGVIRKHAAMVAPGGALVISCPNLRGIQRLCHGLLDGENLRRHHLPAMDLRRWRAVLVDCGMEILHAGYYRTADFWTDNRLMGPRGRWVERRLITAARWIDRRVRWPNRWTSPYLVCVSRRPKGG
jgi:SAM-dependent methyltransferase